MEYYDSINKTDFYSFYFEKSNKLLQKPQVIELLDKHALNISSDNKNTKLFKTNPYQTIEVEKGRNSLKRRSITDERENEFRKIKRINKATTVTDFRVNI
jgi:hypothetical protein